MYVCFVQYSMKGSINMISHQKKINLTAAAALAFMWDLTSCLIFVTILLKMGNCAVYPHYLRISCHTHCFFLFFLLFFLNDDLFNVSHPCNKTGRADRLVELALVQTNHHLSAWNGLRHWWAQTWFYMSVSFFIHYRDLEHPF